jgi:hypothetical protein
MPAAVVHAVRGLQLDLLEHADVEIRSGALSRVPQLRLYLFDRGALREWWVHAACLQSLTGPQ